MTIKKLKDVFKQTYIQKMIFLIVVVVAIISAAWLFWTTQSNQQHQLVIAAGPRSGLSYEVIDGIVKILKDDYQIDAEIIETRDGEENAQLLEQELVQLAAIQDTVLKIKSKLPYFA